MKTGELRLNGGKLFEYKVMPAGEAWNFITKHDAWKILSKDDYWRLYKNLNVNEVTETLVVTSL